MFGRLLKATEYNPNEQVSMPTYDRWGYGARVIYDKEKYLFGMTFFQAKDNETSLSAVPDSLPVFPQSNTAMSWEVGLKLIKNLSLSLEYGISFLNRDNRTVNNTSVYHAVKVGLTYQILSNTFGFGYERIDPGYQSLGAYYFTNDLQNFTLNFSRPFFQEKLNLAFNVGFQHDNLDGNKTEASKRFVGAVNLNYNHNEHLNAAFTYSNFQTFTNVKSQFDYINAVTNYDNRDTLNYTQLSQNAGLNVTYNFGGNAIRKHSLGINFNFQEAADKKGDAVCTGGASQLYNMAANYSLLFVPQNIQLTASSNLSYNTVATNNTLTYGNSIGANAKLFDKFIAAGMVLAYNLSYENGQWQNSVVNIKGNIGCQLFQRHGLNLQLLVQTRNMHLRAFCNDFTATFSYVYTF